MRVGQATRDAMSTFVNVLVSVSVFAMLSLTMCKYLSLREWTVVAGRAHWHAQWWAEGSPPTKITWVHSAVLERQRCNNNRRRNARWKHSVVSNRLRMARILPAGMHAEDQDSP